MDINGLDKINNQIVNALLENGRATASQIAKSVGISRTAVQKRIAQLEESGVISGYKAVVRPQNAIKTITYVMTVEAKEGNFNKLKQVLKDSKITLNVLSTTGKNRLMAICLVSSMEEMHGFLNYIDKQVAGLEKCVHGVLEVVKGEMSL